MFCKQNVSFNILNGLNEGFSRMYNKSYIATLEIEGGGNAPQHYPGIRGGQTKLG